MFNDVEAFFRTKNRNPSSSQTLLLSGLSYGTSETDLHFHHFLNTFSRENRKSHQKIFKNITRAKIVKIHSKFRDFDFYLSSIFRFLPKNSEISTHFRNDIYFYWIFSFSEQAVSSNLLTTKYQLVFK